MKSKKRAWRKARDCKICAVVNPILTIQQPTHEKRVETRACTQCTAAATHPRRGNRNQKLPEHAKWQARPDYEDGYHEAGQRNISRLQHTKRCFKKSRRYFVHNFSYGRGVFEVQKTGLMSLPLRRSRNGLLQLPDVVQRSPLFKLTVTGNNSSDLLLHVLLTSMYVS